MKKIIALLLSFMLFMQPCCTALAAIRLPSALQSIEASAFEGVEGLNGNVVLPEGVQNVGDAAFSDTDVFSMQLPDAAKKIGSGILSGSEATYVVVENPTAVLAADAFDGVGAVVGNAGSTAQRVANPGQFFESENLLWQDGFAYYINGDATVIVAFPEHGMEGEVVIPSAVFGCQVVGASPYAFANLSGVTAIQVPFNAMRLPEEAERFNWPEATFAHVTVEWPDTTMPEGAQRISFMEEVITLIPGDSFHLEDIPLREDLPQDQRFYAETTSNSDAVTIEENDYGCIVTAEKVGEAYLTTIWQPVDDENNIITGENGEGAYYALTKIEVVEPAINIRIAEDPVRIKTGWIYEPELSVVTPSRFTTADVMFKSSDAKTVQVIENTATLQALKPGEATITVSAKVDGYNGAADVTKDVTYKVIVEEPALNFNQPVIYTYVGYEYDLAVTDLPADASAVWTAQEGLITVDETTGHAVVGDVPGSDLITCTVTYADGSTVSEQIPVYIKVGVRWLEDDTNRTDLLPEEIYDIIPDHEADFWNHHKGTVRFSAEIVEENPNAEGRRVVYFDKRIEDFGNRKVEAPVMWTSYPGSARVELKVALEHATDLGTGVIPAQPDTASVYVTVVPPEFEAWLDSDEMYVNAAEYESYFGFGVSGAEGYNYEVSFGTSDPKVFTVQGDGVIIPKGEGEATLTYTVNCYGEVSTATATVHVFGYNLTMTPAKLELTMGESFMIMPVLPEGVELGSSHYEFFSQQPEVAEVNQLGMVIAKSVGTARIIYYTEHEGREIHAECMVTVKPSESSRLSLNAYTLELYAGETFQLEATTQGNVKSIKWESTNPDALDVDDKGLVGQNPFWAYPGFEVITCTVTFADNKVETATCFVWGKMPVVQALDVCGYYGLALGDSFPYKCRLSFVEPYTAEDVTVRYVSENEDVVKVAADGLMTTTGVGVAKVWIECLLEDKVVFRDYGLVYVNTAVPAVDKNTKLFFENDVHFIVAPEEGDARHMGFEPMIRLSDHELRRYFGIEFWAENATSEVFEVYEHGEAFVHGAGEADIYARFYSYGDGVMTADPVAKMHLVSGTPVFEMTVTDSQGNEKTFETDEHGTRHVDIGDIVTVTVAGVPEAVGHAWTNWDYNDHAFIELERTDRKLVLMARESDYSHIHMDTELECRTWFDINDEVVVDEPDSDYRFSENVIFLTKGESKKLYMDFDPMTLEITSSNASVAKVTEEDGEFSVSAVKNGKAILTATATVEGEDEPVTAVCYVHVVDDDWDLLGMDEIANIMYVGEDYPLIAWVHNRGAYGPALHFTFNDSEAGEIWFNEDDFEFWATPKKAGEFILTVTAEKYGQIKTLSKPIVIIERPVSFDTGSYIDLMRGSSMEVSLINNTDKEIIWVDWSTVHSGAASVEAEEGPALTATLTASDRNEEQYTLINALVEFEDHTRELVSARVHVLSSEHVDVRAWLEGDLRMSTEEWGEGNKEVEVWLKYDTNASFDSGDYVQIEWFINGDLPIEEAEAAGFVGVLGYVEEDTLNGLKLQGRWPADFELNARVLVYSADGELLAEDYEGMWVEVTEPVFEIRNMPEEIHVRVGDYVQIGEFGVHTYREHTGNVDTELFYSHNDLVAMVDVHGNIQGIAPGETDVELAYIINGHTFVEYSHVVVEGAYLAFATDHRIMEAGSKIYLDVYEGDNGYEIENRWWTTSNENVAVVTSDGKICANAPGTAVIGYHIHVSDLGHSAVYCTVEVVDSKNESENEKPAFGLDHDVLSLFHEETGRLRMVYNGEGEVDESSIVWSTAEGFVTVDEEGYVTPNIDDCRDNYETVTVEAIINGERVSASCTVIIRARQLRIMEDQFGEGRWYGMGTGEWCDIWEAYVLQNPDIEVEVEITSDDEEVIKVHTFENGETLLEAVGAGHTMVHYTVTADTGESYTRSALFRVDEDTMPESIAPAYETQVVMLWDGERHLDFVTEPAYTGCEFIFESHNPEILSFEDEHDNRMTLHAPGMATVSIYSPENENLYTTARVLVVDGNAIELLPLDGREDLHSVINGETVQLGFFYNGELVTDWGEGVEASYRAHQNYDSRRMIVTDDLTLKMLWPNFDEEIHHWVDVNFNDQCSVSYCYEFHIDQEAPYFYMAHEDDDTITSYVGNAGDSFPLNVITNLPEEHFMLSWGESTDPAVANYLDMGNSVDGTDMKLVCGSKIGQTHIPFTLTNGDLTLEYDYPVEIIAPETPNAWINPENNIRTIQVGEELQLYISFDNTNSYVPDHSFISLNHDILEPVLDENGHHQYGLFRGVAPGEAEVEMTATYGHGSDAKTCTDTMKFYVVSELADAALGTGGGVSLRPGQTKHIPVYITKEGVSSITCVSDNTDMLEAAIVDAENGDPLLEITGVSAQEDANVTVTVTFDDGVVRTLYCFVDMISNEEVVLISYGDEILLSRSGWSCYGTTGETELFIDTNANLDGVNPDRYTVEWRIEDESVARITNIWGDVVEVEAVGDGETALVGDITLTDADGNVLAEHTAWIYVAIVHPWMEITPLWEGEPMSDMYLSVMQDQYIHWHWDGEHFSEPERIMLVSDDENVASFTEGNRIYAVAPGSTTVRQICCYADGTQIEGRLNVHVQGAQVAFDANEITLNLDAAETAYLKPSVSIPADEGWYVENGYWENTDDRVVVLNEETGKLTPVGAGVATVSYWVNVFDSEGNWSEAVDYCTVTVTENAQPAFKLNYDQVTLYGDETVQLQPVYDEALGTVTSIGYYSEGHEIYVTEDGEVFAYAPRRTFHGLVRCEAILTDAQGRSSSYTATCHVTNEVPAIMPRDLQYGQGGHFEHMRFNDQLPYWDSWMEYKHDIEVEQTFESMDESIVTVDENGVITSYEKAGSTDVIMTLRVLRDGEYTGEMHKRWMHVLVDQQSEADSVAPLHNIFMVPREWEQHYLPLVFEPEYTGAYLECYSDNENILGFDEGQGTEMYFHGDHGLVNIDVTCPYNEALNTQAQVLVYEDHMFGLGTVDGTYNPPAPGESLQLKLINYYGMQLTEDEIEVVEYVHYYDHNQITVTQDGLVTLNVDWENDEGYEVYALARTNSGHEFWVRYRFWPDLSKPYARLLTEDNGDHYTLSVGFDTWLQLRTDRDAWSPDELTISTSNDEVIRAEWVEEEWAIRVEGLSEGEAEVYVTLDEERSASFPVKVIIPKTLETHMSIGHDGPVRVGDEFEVYTSMMDEDLEMFGAICHHVYESSDETVLRSLESIKEEAGEDPDHRDWMTFRALKEGTATITSTAFWGEGENRVTDVWTYTINVLPAVEEGEPKMLLMSGSDAQGGEEYLAALRIAAGSDHVIHDVYADNFMDRVEDTANKLTAYGTDPEVKAIVVQQGVPGTVEAFNRIREEREDAPLLIVGMPQESLENVVQAADIAIGTDEAEQADTIAQLLKKWDVDVFVHYSFPRHMAMESVIARHDRLQEYCAEYGIEFLDVTAPDPVDEGGLEATEEFIAQDVPAQMSKYAGKKVAFFGTNCGMQLQLQKSVLQQPNAYYPQPCCPSPYHGYPQALGLTLRLGKDDAALRAIANALNAHGAAGRFSTWGTSVNGVIMEAAADYALGYMNGEITSTNDGNKLEQLIKSYAPGATVNKSVYDGYYTVALSPVDFTEYVTNTESNKVALLTGSSAQGQEEYTAAAQVAQTYGNVLHETYADDFMSETGVAQTIDTIVGFAANSNVKAIVVHQGVPGAVEGFEQVREALGEDAPVLIAGVPQQSLESVCNVADFALSSNEIEQADNIAQLLEKWEIDVFVHYSFPRHLGIYTIAERKARLEDACADMGIEYLEVTAPDPVDEGGLEASNAFIAENVPELMNEYEGQKVAFFCTNCGMQEALQRAVLAQENAYYPQPCCPSPYHAFPATFGLELEMGDDEAALHAIANELNEHGAVGRFSTWASPVNAVIMRVAAAYGEGYANGSITDPHSPEKVLSLLEEEVPGAIVKTEGFANYYTILLPPVDFNDYL